MMLGKMHLLRSLVCFLIAFCLIGCARQPNTFATPEINPPTTQPILSKIPDLSEAEAIRIRDFWSGLSVTAPEKANFYLERKGTEFVGTAEFEVGGYSTVGPLTATVDLIIPLEIIEIFLQKLEEAQVDVDEYIIPPTQPDNYPEFTLNVTTRNGSVELYSNSSNSDRTPWRFSSSMPEAHICHRECVIKSDIPTQALEILEPYLKREIHEQLFEEVSARVKALPEP